MKKRFFVLLMMLVLLLSLCSCRMIGKGIARLIPALSTKAPISDSVAEPSREQNTLETDTEEKAPESDIAPEPEPEATPESSDFVFADSSERLITQAEAAERFAELASSYSPSGKPAQDAVNEIYARHGYTFSTQKILDYYKSKSWYTPRADFSESELNEIEKANIALFQSLK